MADDVDTIRVRSNELGRFGWRCSLERVREIRVASGDSWGTTSRKDLQTPKGSRSPWIVGDSWGTTSRKDLLTPKGSRSPWIVGDSWGATSRKDLPNYFLECRLGLDTV